MEHSAAEQPADDTDEPQTLIDLATAYVSMGDKEEAREVLLKAIEASSGQIRIKAQQMLESLDQNRPGARSN